MLITIGTSRVNRPFPSSPKPLCQSEAKCNPLIFYSHANKTPFHKKGFVLYIILTVRVFGTRKWLIETINKQLFFSLNKKPFPGSQISKKTTNTVCKRDHAINLFPLQILSYKSVP